MKCILQLEKLTLCGALRDFDWIIAPTLVYNALIIPLFDYCDITWSNLLQQDIDRLQRLQNRLDLHGLSHIALAHLKQ